MKTCGLSVSRTLSSLKTSLPKLTTLPSSAKIRTHPRRISAEGLFQGLGAGSKTNIRDTHCLHAARGESDLAARTIADIMQPMQNCNGSPCNGCKTRSTIFCRPGKKPQEPGAALPTRPGLAEPAGCDARRRFLQRETRFTEVGVLDAQGKERLKVSRVLAITDQELGDASASRLFQQEAPPGYWAPS